MATGPHDRFQWLRVYRSWRFCAAVALPGTLCVEGCGARSALSLDRGGPGSDASSDHAGIAASCEPGQPGSAGPIPIAPSAIHAGSFALGGGYAWLAEWPFTGGVHRIPLSGGAAEVLDDNRPNPQAIEAVGSTAVWIDTGLHCGNGTLSRVETSGRVTRLGENLERPRSLAVHDGFVFVGDGPEGPCRDPGRLLRFEVTSGRRSIVADGLATVGALAAHPSGIAFGDGAGQISLVLDAVTATPHIRPLTQAPAAIHRLAVHGRFVYWSSRAAIGRVTVEADSEQVLVEGRCVEGLAADDDGVFFTCRGPAAGEFGLFHVSIDGGEERQLHLGSTNLTAVRTDARRVYWLDLGNAEGSLWTVCKSAVGL